ncbi:nucleotide sugar dehydrogenase [Algiphilus sp.]|uniref:nucleotide sugar dehydrogenase n=1 Tax=Algiphilus sp. TaxID=1872431 RepID=UPI003B52C38C
MARSHIEAFIARAQERSLRVGVVGLGYVGLPLALRCVQAGYSVTGFDIDPDKVQALSEGRSYILHIGSERVAQARNAGMQATIDFSLVAGMDALLICVPTPLTRHREPDMTFIFNTMEQLRPHLQAGQLVVLESTTYPGTTEEDLKPRLEAAGFEIGSTLFLGFSPEREDPGNPSFSTQTIPKIVSGVTPDCLRAVTALYEAVVDQVVPVSSPRVAEMTKLMENIHRAVNIGLVNEMKIAADRMGVDIHEVIAAAATKPFGFVPYRPGPGLGGHCIPIDPFYLTWKAREYGVHTRFIELAGEINSAMPDWVMTKISDALNARSLPLRGSRILVLGLAYKKNIDDLRLSPSVQLLERLRDHGADYAYHDPHVPVFPKLREHRFDLRSVALDAATLSAYDCVILATDHDCFDYPWLQQHARLIVDTRGRFVQPFDNVVRA